MVKSDRLRIAAVIAGGGTGRRMNAAVPKQFLELAGIPILVHTLESILQLEDVLEVVIALPRRHLSRARAILGRHSWRAPVKCLAGGSVRQESVFRAVCAVRPDSDIILVHDAVRPFCDRETMDRVVQAAWGTGGAVPALPVKETIQRVSRKNRVLVTPPRDELYAIQTPQGFRAGILRGALERAAREGFEGTDESSVVRWAGGAVVVVEGSPNNIKITNPLDLEIARMMVSGREPRRAAREKSEQRNSRIRIGHGIDYHRLVAGRKMILGGVEIPFAKGLAGHSDADALSHAICDALLGGAALGDIGKHFPDTDPANRDRPSLEFLRAVRERVEQQGWKIRNLDATLLVQEPRLAPFMAAMRSNIATCLGLSPEDVSIKATTTEGMNAEGRGQGISAHAVALLERVGRKPRRGGLSGK